MIPVTPPVHPGTVNPSDDPRFSVLIADDDRGIRETLGEVLENQGFRTVLAADGDQAVELVQVNLIHLILIDMNMPRLTGLEALSIIRQTLDQIMPAVLMTADATNDLIRRAFQAQAFSVIPKPVNTNLVLHTLTRALAKVYGKPAAAGKPPGNPAAGGGVVERGPTESGERDRPPRNS